MRIISGVRENLRSEIINILLVGGCLWSVLWLSGCKEEQKPTAVAPSAELKVNKDQMNDYLNNSVKEDMPTPEIMHTAEPTDTLKNTPPVNPQVNTSF